jgi:hypothetical protein
MIRAQQSALPPTTPIEGGGTVAMMTPAGGGHDATGVGLDLESEPEHESADRALTGVKRKLDKQLSIEYTVNELIVTAVDPMNLATIYHGRSSLPT